MLPYVLALLVSFQSTTVRGPQDDIGDALAHAEALYYEARFSDSIQLLTTVNDALRAKPDRVQDRINTKLQLALAYIGLNQTAEAKAFLLDIYALDPNYALDQQQFSPKVIALAAEARSAQEKIRCQTAGDDALHHLESGNAPALMDILGSMKAKCSNLAAIEPDAAELLYKTGIAAYKRGEYSNALNNFQSAVRLSPKHDLALQYIDLTQGKLQVDQDRALMQWRKNFDSRQLTQAAADYRQIVSFNDANSVQLAKQAAAEYRKLLTTLVESWNRSCPTGDAAAMNDIRTQINNLLPEPSFGEDIRSQMVTCNKPPAPPITQTASLTPMSLPSNTPSPSSGGAPARTSALCLQMSPQLALARLKTRVEPEIPREAQAYIKNSQVTVRVKARIDENGAVTVADTPDGNPMLVSAVKAAVERWRFTPAVDASGPRCVDTELQMAIGK